MADTENDYQPKHLKQYSRRSSHCCFAGCTPMGCPGGCCAHGFGHDSHCPMNTGNQMDEVQRSLYVSNRLPKHLVSYEADSSKRRHCDCGDICYMDCGPGGCQSTSA